MAHRALKEHTFPAPKSSARTFGAYIFRNCPSGYRFHGSCEVLRTIPRDRIQPRKTQCSHRLTQRSNREKRLSYASRRSGMPANLRKKVLELGRLLAGIIRERAHQMESCSRLFMLAMDPLLPRQVIVGSRHLRQTASPPAPRLRTLVPKVCRPRSQSEIARTAAAAL
jgi:hypothetical protein